jgi:hypothetical protein
VATLDLIGTFGGCGMYVRGGFSYSCPALKLVGYRDDLDLRRAMRREFKQRGLAIPPLDSVTWTPDYGIVGGK